MHVPFVNRFCLPLVLVERDAPLPYGTKVVVEVTRCSLCHTDLHLQNGCYDLGGSKWLDFPIVDRRVPPLGPRRWLPLALREVPGGRGGHQSNDCCHKRLLGLHTGRVCWSLEELKELIALAKTGKIQPLPVEPLEFASVNEALARSRAGKGHGRLVLVH